MSQHDASYFPQLTCWYIKIMESTINTVILIFLIHGNHKFAKVYSAKCILSSNSPKFVTAKVSLYEVDSTTQLNSGFSIELTEYSDFSLYNKSIDVYNKMP